TVLKLRMRARNVGKICRGPSGRSAGGNDEQKRWEEARRLEEGTRDLPSRDPEVCRAGTSRTLAWELGAQPRPNQKNIAELKGRTIEACHSHLETIGTGILARTQPKS